MSNVSIEIFESRDDGAKRYEELLDIVSKDPFNAEWKYLCIEMKGFSFIERTPDCTSHTLGGYYAVGEYRANPKPMLS